MIVAGIGCSGACGGADIVAAVRQAETLAGVRAGSLAAPSWKEGEAGPREAAVILGLPLQYVSREALMRVQGDCPTQSVRARAATGLGAVAEAAALAASGGPLLLARVAQGLATCALAGRA